MCRRSRWLGGLMGALWCGPVLAIAAQDTRPATPEPRKPVSSAPAPAPAPAPGDALLAGPKVEASAFGKGDVVFGAPANIVPRRPIPLADWERCLQRVPLTIEQRAEVESIIGEFRRQWRDFARSNLDEAQQLERSIQRARREGDQPSPEQLGRLQDLKATMPRLQRTELRIWKRLTIEQQRALRMELARQRMPEAAGSTQSQ